jgi:hypothetical protein
MYIPTLQIPGCRPGYKNDNRDSPNLFAAASEEEEDDRVREAVIIPLHSRPTYEAVARFYSYIAYSDRIEATQRENYSIALSRWAVVERAQLDQHWAQSKQAIRPIIFSQEEKLFRDTLRRGSKRLYERSHCAFVMLLPHLAKGLLDGLEPTVSNIALRAGAAIGYEATSQKTFESKIWHPVKPVAHAAAAAMFSWCVLKDPKHAWDEKHQLCYKQSVLATFFYEDVFRYFVLRTAELLRKQVLTCSRFHIGETDRFVIGIDPS